MKAFSYHLPYGQKQAYSKEIDFLSLERLANLIKIWIPDQTKAYLFWQLPSDGMPATEKRDC